jgi:hypothetical protein
MMIDLATQLFALSTEPVPAPASRLQRGEWIAVLLTICQHLCRGQGEFDFSGTKPYDYRYSSTHAESISVLANGRRFFTWRAFLRLRPSLR